MRSSGSTDLHFMFAPDWRRSWQILCLHLIDHRQQWCNNCWTVVCLWSWSSLLPIPMLLQGFRLKAALGCSVFFCGTQHAVFDDLLSFQCQRPSEPFRHPMSGITGPAWWAMRSFPPWLLGKSWFGSSAQWTNSQNLNITKEEMSGVSASAVLTWGVRQLSFFRAVLCSTLELCVLQQGTMPWDRHWWSIIKRWILVFVFCQKHVQKDFDDCDMAQLDAHQPKWFDSNVCSTTFQFASCCCPVWWRCATPSLRKCVSKRIWSFTFSLPFHNG